MMVGSIDGNPSVVAQDRLVEVVVLGEGPLLMLLDQNMVGEYLVGRHRQVLGLSKMMGLPLKMEDDRLQHWFPAELFEGLGIDRMPLLLGSARRHAERASRFN
jgi:hypothetical protein